MRQHRDPAPRCVGEQTDPPVFRGPGQRRERGWGEGGDGRGGGRVGRPLRGLQGGARVGAARQLQPIRGGELMAE